MATILIVDDNPLNRELIVTLAGHKGHRVLEAADGAEALVTVWAERPDLVISDILMPTMDGYEFVRQMRADPAIAQTEVIFYTAFYHDREARNLARECGVTRILNKPCEPSEILRSIDAALGGKKAPVSASITVQFDHEHLRLITDKLSEKVAELEASNQRLGALTDLNLQLASERDPHVLLTKVCRGARDLLGAKYAVLAVGARNAGIAKQVATSGMDADTAARLGLPELSEGPLGEAFANRKTRRLINTGDDPRHVGLPAEHPAVHAFLVAPVVSLAYTYGWICLTDKLGADEFSADDEKLLGILAAQVGRIYENGSLYSALRESQEGLHRAQVMAKLAHVVTLPGGNFESWSETMPDLLGVEPEKVPRSNREWLSRMTGSDSEAFRAKMVEAAKTGTGFSIEYRLRQPNGNWIDIHQVSEPLDAGGRERGLRWFGILQDVTAQKRGEETLERFRAAMDISGDGIILIDRASLRYIDVNQTLCGMIGRTREEMIGLTPMDIFSAARETLERDYDAIIADNNCAATEVEGRYRHSNGTEFPIEARRRALRTDEGWVIVSTVRDISERKVAEAKILRLNRVYAVLSGINTLIVRVRDLDELFREACRVAVEAGKFVRAWIGTIDPASKRVTRAASAGVESDIFDSVVAKLNDRSFEGRGMVSKAMIARHPVVSNDIAADPHVFDKESAIAKGSRAIAALPLIAAGEIAAVLVLHASEVDFFDADEMKLLTELAGDISFAMGHIEKSEKLDYLAYYDELTGLANRTLFQERLDQHLAEARSNGKNLALLLMNIERFKLVNDALGRQAGDEFLRQIARRLLDATKEPGRLCRLGGDVFAVMTFNLKGAEEMARRTEERIVELFGDPFRIGETELRASAKFGIAMFPDDGDDAETLFRNAEAALKKAKSSGEPYLFYTQKMTRRVSERLSLENKLREAIEKEQFVLHYQPKVDLETRQIAGVEALIRWQSPELGLVPPVKFIPLLEETGLILPVGAWALRQAMRDHKDWVAQGLAAPRVAVNVSPIQLRRPDFVASLTEAIKEGASPHGLDLEITESLIMEDIEGSIEKLKAARELGIQISIDDFGTGYSSLAYLAKLPVQTLKIDRAFIITMLKDPNVTTLVQTMISLAHSLRLKVVAEGVEEEAQANMLRLLRCEQMQGYLFSKPLPVAELTKLLRKPV